MAKTQDLLVNVKLSTSPIRKEMLALADMYEQAAAAMRAGVERLDRLEEDQQ